MADLSITTTQVKAGTGARVLTATAAEAISPGQTVCKLSTGVYKFDANNTSVCTCSGVAVNLAGAAGQHITYVQEGDVILGTSCAMTKGVVYIGSLTAGGLVAITDSTSTGYINIVGVCEETATGTLAVRLVVSGVTGAI